jgi:hypothetical protein
MIPVEPSTRSHFPRDQQQESLPGLRPAFHLQFDRIMRRHQIVEGRCVRYQQVPSRYLRPPLSLVSRELLEACQRKLGLLCNICQPEIQLSKVARHTDCHGLRLILRRLADLTGRAIYNLERVIHLPINECGFAAPCSSRRLPWPFYRYYRYISRAVCALPSCSEFRCPPTLSLTALMIR